MRILYYDCFSGISGDMNLAALLALGVDPGHLQAELAKLGLDDEFSLHISRETRSGIQGLRVDVLLRNNEQEHGTAQGHEEHHAHAEHAHPHYEEHAGHHHDHKDHAGHHHHGHGDHHHHGDEDHAGHHHDHEDHAHHHHHGRNFAEIRALIEASALEAAVKETALTIFQKVAEAEAQVHGKAIDEVHFHEVGAVDSIVDIVGAAICLHSLQVEEVWSGVPELGGGFVRCAHGLMPVPAPATEAILHALPTRRGGADFECTTPTGAAILAATVSRFIDAPLLTVEKSGYGIGHHADGERPNLLRVQLAETSIPTGQGGAETVAARLVQCNLDDMSGEEIGALMDLLLAEGAMDVHFTPIVMKKNRPAVQVSVLCAAQEARRFQELLFRHTSTFGVKSFPLEKTELARRTTTVATTLGSVRVKEALWDGKVLHAKPEFEDCRKLAEQHGLPLQEVLALVRKEHKK